MPLRSAALRPSSLSTTTVCVDSFQSGIMSGRFYSPCLRQPMQFEGVFQLIERMERMFDDLSYPQAYNSYRSFRKSAGPARPPRQPRGAIPMAQAENTKPENGKKATFVVQVQFRQNATWQGTISWAEEKRTQHFRSTLEMIKLMSDALTDEQEQEVAWDEPSGV